MFNFLNTSVLFAAAAALIPLIIHLFSKRKVKIIEFSSVKHLKMMQKRQVRKLKIKQLLLLLLRMLIIFLVVLAFARPTTETGSFGSHASVSAVILFDNSVSMDRYVSDGNLFDIAKKRTGELLDNFGESDEILLLPLADIAGKNADFSFSSVSTVREILDNISANYMAADLEKGLINSLSKLKEAKNLNKEIYIITDYQRSILPDSTLSVDTSIPVNFIALPTEENDNCGIVSVDFGGQLIIPGHDFTIKAMVKNQSNEKQTNLIASLIINGNRMAQTEFAVDAESETEVTFTRSVSTSGFHSGYVEISDDKFVEDNRFYFSFKIPDHFNLLIIDSDNTGEIMKLALSPATTINQYWSTKITKANALAGINFWDYDVLFLTGAPKLETTYIQRIKSFLTQGRPVFITYDGQTDSDYFNKTYSELTGVRIDEPARLDFTRAGYYSLLSINMNHPVFSVFDYKADDIPELKFFTLPKVSTITEAESIMLFTGERPALVEHRYKSGKVLTFTGPLAPNYSDITANSFFVPMLSRIAEYLASDLSEFDFKSYCAQNITRVLPDNISTSGPLTLLTPDSTEYNILPEDEGSRIVAAIPSASLPGAYSILSGLKEIDKFSLNLNPTEAELYQTDVEQLSQAIGAKTNNLLAYDSQIGELLAEIRFGNELWQLFLWIAVVLLAIEMILSRSKVSDEEQ
ncbi:MAG: VWA domain-containing protein [Calditrichaeota bacterium]|nr:MAG: VWA domain-containing protein [Calditrichota bacterium]